MLFFNVQAVFTFKQVQTLCTVMPHFESTVRSMRENGTKLEWFSTVGI